MRDRGLVAAAFLVGAAGIRTVGDKAIDLLTVLLGENGAGHIKQFTPAPHNPPQCIENTRLGGGEARDVGLAAQPFAVRVTAHDTAGGAGDIGENRVEIGVITHGEGARNRRRRHHQLMGRFSGGRISALLSQRQALLHAKAVLFVDDGQPQSGEIDRILDQRVRTDHELCAARGLGLHRLLGRRLEAAGQPRDAHPERFQPGAQFEVMLFGQYLGRRHESGLPPRLDRPTRRKRRDDGLATADIALQQSLHRIRRLQIAIELGHDALLRAGQRKGKPLQ
jgi:hypothetical protein